MLKRADFNELTPGTRKKLEEITRECTLCQLHSQRPLRFKFTLPVEKDFNQSVYVDMMYLEKKPLLHVVCEATMYQAARWLPRTTAEELWRAFRLCWVDVYLGPPDLVVHDAGTNLMANAFQLQSGLLHIATKPVPVESAHSMNYVERYHEPLRRAFKIIKQEAPDLDPDAALQCAVKSVNDSAGPDGLVPTLLVYGALPRLGLPTDKPTSSMLQRGNAVRKATAAMARYFARRQVTDALRARNGSSTHEIHSLPLGSLVLVYRIPRARWEGPFKLLDHNGEQCTVLCPNGPTTLRSALLKPYIAATPEATPTTEPTTGAMITHYDSGISQLAEELSRTDLPSPRIFAATEDRFAASRKRELDGLLERGVMLPVPRRVFGARFVDKLKDPGTSKESAKSRLVIQGFNDRADGLLTYAPSVQRSSQRLLFSLAPAFPSWRLAQRDISQAYTQSTSVLDRDIFVKPPREMSLPEGLVLKLQRPLYGVPEAGVH